MATWKYYEQTGETGGTTSLIYVDSHNGDDANPGTHLLPKQSLQGGFDAVTNGAIVVISGYFKESELILNGGNTTYTLICEGYCMLDCSNGNLAINNGRRLHINHFDNMLYGAEDIINVWAFGFLHLKNVNGFKSFNTSTTGYYNVFLENCFTFGLNASLGFWTLNNCIIKNGLTSINNTGFSNTNAAIKNCVLFGDIVLDSNARCTFKNNYIAPSTKVEFGNIAGADLNYNLFQGTLADKITINGTSYNNTEALQAALPTYAVNDLPSTTNPLFNGMSDEDFTPTESSPLLGAGENGVNIGAFNVSIGQAADSANWTLSNIDNTTNPDAAVLDGGGSGTLTATAGIQLFTDGSRRVINRILLPGTVIDPEFGETVNSQLSISGGTPSKYSVEIQYSTDGGSTYNGTWLKVPYGSMPLHDTVNNVGNADPAFVSGGRISATHVLPRITLRNNDI
jgi:hypothetical protein